MAEEKSKTVGKWETRVTELSRSFGRVEDGVFMRYIVHHAHCQYVEVYVNGKGRPFSCDSFSTARNYLLRKGSESPPVSD